MSKKGKKKPPDGRSRAQNLSRPADVAQLHGETAVSHGGGPDRRPAKIGRSSSLLSRYAAAAVCGLLMLAVALVFAQTAGHAFINLDDDDYVGDNPPVARGFTAQGIVWAFTHVHSNNWHPLTWLSHTLDCQLYGLQHPGGHHLTNVLLHAASAVVLFLVLRQMTGNLWPSAFAAALFAIHPLHVESVAWVAERKDVLSGLFFMLTLAAYTGYVRRPFSLSRYMLVTLLFALGLMAKLMLVTLPFVLALLDYWPLGRGKGAGGAPAQRVGERGSGSRDDGWATRRPWWLIVEKLPWLMLAAVSCVVTYWAQGTAVADSQCLPLSARIANGLVSCVDYLGQFFYPVGLAPFYPLPQDSLPIWKVVGSGVLLAGISLVVLACRRKCPYLPVGWLWYLGMLLPVIGLVQVGLQAKADRYTYLPQIGLYMAIAWGFAHVASSWRFHRWPLAAVSALVVAAFTACAWQQTWHWCDSETLWTHALACTSQNPIAHNNLGLALIGRGQVEDAIDHYQEALKIKPGFADAHYSLGNALIGLRKLDEAIVQYKKALETKPNHVWAHYNLGLALVERGQIEEGIGHFQKVLEIKPDDVKAHYSLGNVLLGRGQVAEAIGHFQKALEIQPDNAKAHYSLGNALVGRGQIVEAIDHYQQALEISPDFADAYYGLGNALLERGQIDEAIGRYQKALEINPRHVGALNNIAWLRATQPDPKLRDGPQAVTLARRAVELSPGDADLLGTLAAAYAETGRFAEAAQTARKALDIAGQQNNRARVESIQAKIRLYEAGKPFHEPPRAPFTHGRPAEASDRP